MTRYVCKDPERLSLLKKTFPWFTDELIQETLRSKFKDIWEGVKFSDPTLESNEYFSICKSMFDEQEDPLEPYVWYPQSKWDNNPNNYWVVIKVKPTLMNIEYLVSLVLLCLASLKASCTSNLMKSNYR